MVPSPEAFSKPQAKPGVLPEESGSTRLFISSRGGTGRALGSATAYKLHNFSDFT